MVEQRVVRKDGKLVGYREVSDLSYIERTRKEVAERKNTREALKRADYALDLWARWMLTSSGYGDSPMATMDNPRVPPKSTPPIGCHEAPEIVLSVMRAFAVMKEGDKTNRRYVVILSQLYMGRMGKESIELTIKRLQMNVSMFQVRRAKEALASVL